jgi:hypothetical protein
LGFKPYTELENFNLTVDQNNIVLEIGSERGEGSSLWLHEWAKQHNIEFYSVDVEHGQREQDHPEINWIVTSSGSDWCKNMLPDLNKKIKVLYLDNFDWIWEPTNISWWIQKQIDSYAQRGVTMNNQNCQEEHRLQIEYCLPYLDKQSVVIMDDTYYKDANKDQLTGKCATAIPLLLENGFKMYDTEYATRGCE